MNPKTLRELDSKGPIVSENEKDIDKLLSYFEETFDLPAGSLPRTVQEARKQGFTCLADAITAAAGMTKYDWNEFITTVIFPMTLTGGVS